MQRTVGYALSVLILATLAHTADNSFVLHKRVNEVQFTVVATDSTGRPWPQLSPSELTIADDGRFVPDFQVRAGSDLPLRVGIVLDSSDSMRRSWPAVRSALSTSLKELIRPGDQMLMVTFSNRIESESVVQGPDQLATVLATQDGGLTALYDSLFNVCRHETFRSGEVRRSALILFSDGQDNLSYRGLRDAIEQAVRAGISIYTITAHKPKLRRDGDGVLQEIASATGGRDFVVKDARELQSALQAINEELRSSYLIYYRVPDDASLGYRRVQIEGRPASNLHVRTRAGYFMEP